MTRRSRETVAMEIFEQVSASDVPIVHLDLWYGRRDLWVYRDDRGQIRTVMPERGLPTPLPEGEFLAWPPLGPFLASQGL